MSNKIMKHLNSRLNGNNKYLSFPSHGSDCNLIYMWATPGIRALPKGTHTYHAQNIGSALFTSF